MDYQEPKTRLDVLKFFTNSLFGEENLWDGARILLADVQIDEDEAKNILPQGLKLNGDEATIFIADYPKTSFTVPYREAAVLLHVRSPFGKGIHCPWMIVDDDTAMIYGRELLGFPKKMGVFEFEESGSKVKASIARRDVKVLEMEAKLGDSESDPAPVLGTKIFNAGGPGQFFIHNPLWVFNPIEEITESYEAKVKVTVRDSEHDPISKLFSSGNVSGRFTVLDIKSAKYHVPIGASGLMHFGKTFLMRYR